MRTPENLPNEPILTVHSGEKLGLTHWSGSNAIQDKYRFWTPMKKPLSREKVFDLFARAQPDLKCPAEEGQHGFPLWVTYSCSPYWRHSIMHSISGVPIESAASFPVGDVQKRVTHNQDIPPGKVFGSLTTLSRFRYTPALQKKRNWSRENSLGERFLA